MIKHTLTTIVLAAGNGSRMKSSLPKYAHKLGGFKLVEHCWQVASDLLSNQIITVVAEAEQENVTKLVQEKAFLDADLQKNNIAEFSVVVQKQAKGSGDAVKSALNSINNTTKVVLILYCDTPLISKQALQQLVGAVASNKAEIAILGFNHKPQNSYGRIVTQSQINQNEKVIKIVEAKDLTPEQQGIILCNSGVMAIKAELLPDFINKIHNNNSAKEYYLTDIVEIANQDGFNCVVIAESKGCPMGVNSKLDLATLEVIFQTSKRQEFLEQGVTMLDPNSVYFAADTKIKNNVVIHPSVIFKRGVNLEDDVVIESFCHLEGVTVKARTKVGPFARIRDNSMIGENSRIGSFVEVKNSILLNNVKAMHLAYIGDSNIGSTTTIGAGVITCNFDGLTKHQTNIGNNCFVGSNTSLIAPLTLADNVTIGAGSVITKNVDTNSLALSRPQQIEVHNWHSKSNHNKK